MRQRTQLINALRAHLAEFGLVAAQGCNGLVVLVGTSGTRRTSFLKWRRRHPENNPWLMQLLACQSAKVVVLANKIAHIAWASLIRLFT